MPTQFGGSDQPEKWAKTSTGDKMSDLFQQKVRAEWDAIKQRDKKAYGDLLAEDYEGVEVDGKGERTKIQALNELSVTNTFEYTLWGFSLIPAGPDGVLVIYESTMQFPPKSVLRFSRVYISELWLKRSGEWREVHYQETHVK
ncbi:MAG TPA: nuclear transport factor 2 family protein [Candidatus Binatia bacterium]|nr:nuclear transport factor 2 family protein [Candidatus Binatia bacterium]